MATPTSGIVEYTMRYRGQQVHREQGRPCTMMVVVVTIGDDTYELDVHCNLCESRVSGGVHEYLEYYETMMIDLLASEIQGFSIDPEACDIIKTPIIQASTDYRCPNIYRRPGKKATVLCVEIEIQNYQVLDDVDADPPGMKPASRWSRELLIDHKVIEEDDLGCEAFESGWVASDHECVICMEQIEKRIASTTLPCSHVFHEDCIIPWLEKSHLCPLCRYAMPTEDPF